MSDSLHFMPLLVYGLLSLSGWLWLPLLAGLLPAAAEKGAGIARYVVLLVGGWLAWWLAAAGLGRAAFWLALALLVLAGAVAWVRWGRHTLAWIRQRWRVLLALELVGAAVYAGGLLLRGWSADITTLEKYANLAVINSIVLVPQVPPQNAWFGGEPLNYYYLGHWLLAWLSQLTGLPPNDLVIYTTPLLAACCAQMCITVVASLLPGLSLAGGVRWSLLAVYLLLLCGSLNELVYAVRDWRGEWASTFFASQIAPPIRDALSPGGNLFEFPAVSLLQGEIHAHVLGIPLLVLLLALLAGEVARRAQPDHGPWGWGQVGWYLLCLLAIGCGYALNSWQYPIMLLLWLAVLTWAVVCAPAAQTTTKPTKTTKVRLSQILTTLALLAGGIAGSVLLLLPFWLTFETFAAPLPTSGPGSSLQPLPFFPDGLLVWSPVGTSLPGLLRSIGLPLLVCGVAALWQVRGGGWRWLLAGLLAGLLTAWYRPGGLLLLPCAAVGLWLALAPSHQCSLPASPCALRLGGLWLAFAALLVLGCDYVMIPDHTFSRSNTVFKFSIQAWILLALAAPLLLAGAVHMPAPRLRVSWLRPVCIGAVALLLLAGSVFPVLRGRQWLRYHGDRWWGLDGLAQLAHYHPDEAAAIAWLRAQPGSGGVLESISSSTNGTDERLRPAHFSALTGRPTPRGWSGHTAQWSNYRSDAEVRETFENNGALVLGFPRTQAITDVYVLMQRYELDYVAYGALEKRIWGERGRHLLDTHLPLVWQAGAVRLYGRPPDLPPVLHWLDPHDWGGLEYTTDGNATPFRWLQEQQGRLSLVSTAPALVALRLEVINSVTPGQVTIRQAGQTLAQWRVRPYQPAARTLRLLLPPGTTHLEVATDSAARQEAARQLTLAITPPRLRYRLLAAEPTAEEP